MKLPRMLIAPPTVFSTLKPFTVSRAVLLAIRKPPPMLVSLGQVMFTRSALLTKETSPVTVWVRLGAVKLVKKLESKRMEPLTVARAGTLKLDTLEMVMLAIHFRSGKLTSRSRPLALMLSRSLRLLSDEV